MGRKVGVGPIKKFSAPNQGRKWMENNILQGIPLSEQSFSLARYSLQHHSILHHSHSRFSFLFDTMTPVSLYDILLLCVFSFSFFFPHFLKLQQGKSLLSQIHGVSSCILLIHIDLWLHCWFLVTSDTRGRSETFCLRFIPVFPPCKYLFSFTFQCLCLHVYPFFYPL